MAAGRANFNTSIALHWYEWQQGPLPGEDNRYKFDTHYPDYFPPRPGFQVALSGLRELGIPVVPYTNARLFDVNSTSFLTEPGASIRRYVWSCVLQPNP
jgi:hypothetical protein